MVDTVSDILVCQLTIFGFCFLVLSVVRSLSRKPTVLCVRPVPKKMGYVPNACKERIALKGEEKWSVVACFKSTMLTPLRSYM